MVRLIVLINVSQGIHVLLLRWHVVGLLKFVLKSGMRFVVDRVNIWLSGFGVMLGRAIVRELILVCGLVLLIKGVCLRLVGLGRLEGLDLAMLEGAVGLVKLVPTATILKRHNKCVR